VNRPAYEVPVKSNIEVEGLHVPIRSGSLSEKARSDRVPVLVSQTLREGGALAIQP
jgi:hypothetical protein